MLIKKAFSLIELMIVITIIGILASVAVPAYQDYIIRTKINLSLVHLNKYKTDVMEYFSINGSIPPNDWLAELPLTMNTDDIRILFFLNQGSGTLATIVVEYMANAPSQIAEKRFILEGTLSNGQISWGCRSGVGGAGGVIDAKYIPSC